MAYRYPPDVVIRLDIPIETAMERKAENTFERAESRIAQVRGIEIENANIVDIDATQEFDDVVSKSMAVLWVAL
jgi:thymidylate kinase